MLSKSTDNTNKTNNNPVVDTTMKEIRIPIISILPVLISILGLGVFRKEK